MSDIFAVVEDFFRGDDWPVTQVEDRLALRTGFTGDNGEFNCYAQVRDEHEQFVFYSVFPVKVPEEKRMAVVDFISRANYGMIVGNFEIDQSDGEVRYKTSVDLEGVEVQTQLLRNLIYANVLTMDKYFPGLMRVVYGGISAEDAVHEIEGNPT